MDNGFYFILFLKNENQIKSYCSNLFDSFSSKISKKSKNKFLKKYSIEVFSSKKKLSPIIINGKDNRNKSITHLTKFYSIIESLETSNLRKDFQNVDWNTFFGKTNFKDFDIFEKKK